MKKLFVSLSVALLALTTSQTSQAATLAQWTFETSPPADLTDSATISGILADLGTGTASGVHASALTDWSTPSGNGSANSISANTWAIGDYYQFSTATTGFQDLMLGWAQTSSATGPGEFTLAYQINGGGYVNFLDYTVLPNQVAAPGLGNWSGTEITGYNFLADLSLVSGLDNAAAVDFRLIMRTSADATPPGTVAAGGTDRVDNFTVTAAAVPEPSSFVLAAIGGAVMLGWFRRRK